MPVTLPASLVDGDLAEAVDVMGHVNALASKFTEGAGGIADADIANGAAIDGDKLATNSIPADRLEDNSVLDTKLASAAPPGGLDSQRAVSGNHIKSLDAADLERILPDTPLAGIGSDKLKLTVQKVAFSANGSGSFTPVTPPTPIPIATSILVAAYLVNTVPVSQTEWHWHIDDATGGVYRGFVNIAIQAGSPSVNGWMVFVAMVKA